FDDFLNPLLLFSYKNKLSHSGLAIGMSLGLIYGLLFDNLALGLSLGLLFGYAGDQKILKKK
ncbi:MAG TPA: hypothetical protein DEQ64_19590, partial [Lachnoclostridium sp.]|nr:hypothetical protein [Lachnoclostridium sp.]